MNTSALADCATAVASPSRARPSGARLLRLLCLASALLSPAVGWIVVAQTMPERVAKVEVSAETLEREISELRAALADEVRLRQDLDRKVATSEGASARDGWYWTAIVVPGFLLFLSSAVQVWTVLRGKQP